MISRDILEICTQLEHCDIKILKDGPKPKNGSSYEIICNGKNDVLKIKEDGDFMYACVYAGTILKLGKEWYMELPIIDEVDYPIITYINYFSGRREAVAVTLGYNTIGGVGILDVPIDKFNKSISDKGFKKILDWEKNDFIKYKLIKDDHNEMFDHISFDLSEFVK